VTTSTQISTTVTAGAVKPFAITGPDGHDAPFNIPKGFVFVITDISMQRLSVVGTAGLFDFSIQQALSKNGTINRWTFIGKVAENVERTFNDGIVFSSEPTVENGSLSADTIIVRAWGHFAAQY
jgi:hypothetical protein